MLVSGLLDPHLSCAVFKSRVILPQWKLSLLVSCTYQELENKQGSFLFALENSQLATCSVTDLEANLSFSSSSATDVEVTPLPPVLHLQLMRNPCAKGGSQI